MNGKLRFSPTLTTIFVLAWVGGLVVIYFLGPYPLPDALRESWIGKVLPIQSIGIGKQMLFQAGWIWLGSAISLLNVPSVFWPLCADRLIDVAVTLLLIASAWGLGLSLLRILRLVHRIEPLTHLLSTALGLGLWSWFVLIAGLFGKITAPLYVWPAVLSLPLWVWHRPWLTKQWTEFREAPRDRLRAMEWFLIVCLGLGFLLNVIPAFSPETEYDTLEYHLGALNEYQKQGRIVFLPYNFYASMPSLTEMLYLWGITLRSSTIAKLIHGSFGLLTAFGLISFGKRLHSRRLGLTAAALFYLLPFVTNLADTARIDLATTFFAFLAGAALHRYVFEERRSFLWLAAMSAGLALATKYTAGPVVLLPLLLTFVICRHSSAVRSDAPRSTLHALCFLLIALVPVLPWLIKNMVFTGNPVFPIAQSLFHSREWDEARSALFNSHHGPSFHTLKAWAGFFTLAWNDSAREAFSSPILLAFAPLFLLLAKPEPRWKFCVWYGCLIYVGWFAGTFRPWRFLFPAFPWFALVGAVAIVSLEKERAVGLLVRASLAILLLFNLNYSFILNAVDVADPDQYPPVLSRLAVFFGRVSPADFLGSIFLTAGWMNSNLPADACVLYVGEARTYYARYRVLANTVYDKSIVGEMVARSKTPDDLLKEMELRGITHIYIRQDELDRLRRNYGYLKDMNWMLFNEFLQAHTRIIYRNNTHIVYAIVSVNLVATSKG